jgi:hypothetical protein
MIDLEIQFDLEKYKELFARCVAFNKSIDKAISRAALRAAEAGKTEAKRQIANEYTLPSSKIAKGLAAKQLKEGAQLRIFSTVQALIDFQHKPKVSMPPAKGPVQVQVRKGDGSSELGHAFVAKIPSGHIGIFEREGEKRKSKDTHGREIASSKEKDHIQELQGPSIVGMFKANENVHASVEGVIRETFDKRIVHEVERLLNE